MKCNMPTTISSSINAELTVEPADHGCSKTWNSEKIEIYTFRCKSYSFHSSYSVKCPTHLQIVEEVTHKWYHK